MRIIYFIAISLLLLVASCFADDDSYEQKWAIFQDWLKDKGIENEYVTLGYFNGVRGLMAIKDIEVQ